MYAYDDMWAEANLVPYDGAAADGAGVATQEDALGVKEKAARDPPPDAGWPGRSQQFARGQGRTGRRSQPHGQECRASDMRSDSTGMPIFGCAKCKFSSLGCMRCLGGPIVQSAWKPGQGDSVSVPPVPSYYPTEEEFADPLQYVARIRPEAEKFGICRIVPPASWKPPFALPNKETLEFETRIQTLHELMYREAGPSKSPAAQAMDENELEDEADAAEYGEAPPPRHLPSASGRMGPAGGSGSGGGGGGRMGPAMGRMGPVPSRMDPAGGRMSGGGPSIGARTEPMDVGGSGDETDDGAESKGNYSFPRGERHTLKSFERYATYFKRRYFVDERGESQPSVSVEDMEGEFWRLVHANKASKVEVIYGADVATMEVGSGFPAKGKCSDEKEEQYATHRWNVCNMPYNPKSCLHIVENTTGITVPWLYFGMVLSAFCWHVEDHNFYSVNYHHWGDEKVWYSVPSSASKKFEATMRAKLPHLFESQPDLLHGLCTELSPRELLAAGVPVYRAVQEQGNFIITFPYAYHSGFNCGYNCAEAVNFAPSDWLPFGNLAQERYSQDSRFVSVSHDKMLLNLAEAAGDEARAWEGLNGQLASVFNERLHVERIRRSDALCTRAATAVSMANRSFDDEQDCVVCQRELFWSRIVCECSAKKYTCLEHSHCSCDPQRRTLVYRHSLGELAGIGQRLSDAATTKGELLGRTVLADHVPDPVVARALRAEESGVDDREAQEVRRAAAQAARAGLEEELTEVRLDLTEASEPPDPAIAAYYAAAAAAAAAATAATTNALPIAPPRLKRSPSPLPVPSLPAPPPALTNANAERERERERQQSPPRYHVLA